MLINTVTVLGANGTMGRNVSAIFASFGNAKVYMVARNIEDAIKAKQDAINSVKSDSIEVNLIPCTYADLSEIIPQSDLVFESVSEDLSIKKDIYNQIISYLKDDVIVGSGTSGLSINSLSEIFPEKYRKSFFGIHMFNPPYSLRLCEIIPNDFSDTKVKNKLIQYVERVLFRVVVEVEDSPGFLGNLIGFTFMNNLLKESANLKMDGGIDYIDALFSGFTGRGMSPLFTIDFVGLDIHTSIIDNLSENLTENNKIYNLPIFFKKLVSEGKLGRKTKEGLYKRNNDGLYVYDVESQKYRPLNIYNLEFISEINELLRNGKYKNFAQYVLDSEDKELSFVKNQMLDYVLTALKYSVKLSSSIHSADAAMANGFNWIPPLAIIDLFGGKESFRKIMLNHEREEEFLDLYDLIEPSSYDYRKYILAR